MKKLFRERLEESLIYLEEELQAPETYRHDVMALVDKIQAKRGWEMSEESFERIKSGAENHYRLLVSNHSMPNLSTLIDETAENMYAFADGIKRQAAELEESLDELEEIRERKKRVLH